jgi:hypothetical protein
MAKDILSKFGSWMCLRDIEVAIKRKQAALFLPPKEEKGRRNPKISFDSC